MKIQLAGADQGDARLARTVAITFIGAMAILALYYGQDVLIPVAVAVLFAFILGPAVSLVRRLLPLPLAVAVVVLGAAEDSNVSIVSGVGEIHWGRLNLASTPGRQGRRIGDREELILRPVGARQRRPAGLGRGRGGCARAGGGCPELAW
jgi:hypothetical protein